MLCGPCPFLTHPGAHTLCQETETAHLPDVRDSEGGDYTQLTLPSGQPKVSMVLETTKKELLIWTQIILEH